VPTILLLEWISAALNVGLIVEIAARRLSWGPQMAHKSALRWRPTPCPQAKRNYPAYVGTIVMMVSKVP
jgi:hypothetical protein